MPEPDYKAFYEAAIGIAEGLQFLTEEGAGNLTTKESAMLSIIARNIVFAAEEYVPGGMHTEVFNIDYKED